MITELLLSSLLATLMVALCSGRKKKTEGSKGGAAPSKKAMGTSRETGTPQSAVKVGTPLGGTSKEVPKKEKTAEGGANPADGKKDEEKKDEEKKDEKKDDAPKDEKKEEKKEEEKKEELKPKQHELDEKQKKIAMGATRNKNDYPTMKDIESDWDSAKDKRDPKKAAEAKEKKEKEEGEKKDGEKKDEEKKDDKKEEKKDDKKEEKKDEKEEKKDEEKKEEDKDKKDEKKEGEVKSEKKEEKEEEKKEEDKEKKSVEEQDGKEKSKGGE